MDPDIPVQSVEHDEQSVATRTNNFANFRDKLDSPLASSSPNKTPFKTPLSHPATPSTIKSPQSPSFFRNERKSSPNLQPKRSSSSLSVSRGSTPPSRPQIRRVPSNLSNSTLATDMKPQDSAIPVANIAPSRPSTAEDVAKEYFERELKAHAEWQSETAVIVHDSCYGHRFSRPKTSKAALSTIVERPERIHATLLGASTAYVRLGERHSDGKHGPHPDRNVKDLSSPPFLLKKTTRSVALNDPAVTHVHGTKWMEELQIMCDSAESKLAMNGKELQRPIGYGKDENGNNLPKLHEGDLYLCSESLAALQGCLGGVCDAVDMVFSSTITKRAFVCIRPPGHHCSSNFPSGFCWLNNVHVGISYAAINHGLTHAAIIDFDLHHGDGSQTVTWDHNNKAQSLPKNAPHHKKTPMGYYSLHDINSYPCEWGDEDKVRNASLCIANAHGQSIWNVHLEPWKSLEHFWQLYETKYKVLLDQARIFLQHHSERLRNSGIQPKAAIFLSAGFDASQWEGQGMQRHSVNVPTEFYARLTSDVVTLASQVDLGVDGRIVSVLEGGYSDRALASGVLSHLCGLSQPAVKEVPMSNEVRGVPNGLGVQLPDMNIAPIPSQHFDPEWWSEANLKSLENRTSNDISPLPRKQEKIPGNYSSPTQASTARMTDVARERRSISAQLETTSFNVEIPEPGPPQPVNWVVASHVLSQILIPNDRQTLSCRHDELNAEATRVRRERQSAIGLAVPAEKRMQLRTRGKQVSSEPEAVRAASRTSNRRTTIAVVSEFPDPSIPSERPRRRSSAASSILSSFQDMKLDDRNLARTDQLKNAPSRSMASEPAAKELASKKSKMVPTTKKTAPRVSSPRKAKAVAQPTTKSTAVRDTRSRSASRSRRNSSNAVASGDGMDSLANEMKKVSIKLKMPTPEQHAENQKKAEDSKVKKPRVTKKQTSAKSPTAQFASTPIDGHVKGQVKNSDLDALSGNTAANEMPTREDIVHEPESTNPVYVSPASPNGHTTNPWVSEISSNLPPVSGTTSGNTASNNDYMLPRSTETRGFEQQAGYGPIQYEAFNSGNGDFPKKTRADLPVFTSSSPIPFASAQHHTAQPHPTKPEDTSIWDMPDTPKR